MKRSLLLFNFRGGLFWGILVLSSAFGDTTTTERGVPIEEGQMLKGYSAPAGVEIQGSRDINITGTFIYWQTLKELEYALHTSSPYVVDGDGVAPKFRWKPGFKVGAGVNLDSDGWSFYTEWTYMTSKAKGSVDHGSEYLYPILLNSCWKFNNNAGCHAMTLDAKSTFNQLDLIFSRAYYCGRTLILEPEVGAKGIIYRSKQREYLTYVYGYYAFNANTLFAIDWARILNKYNYWAIGPECGLKADWLLGRHGFKFFGEANTTLAYVRAKYSTGVTIPTNSEIVLASNGILLNAKIHDANLIRCIIEGNVGIGWEKYFNHNKLHLGIDLGYNFIYFPNIQTVIIFQQDVTMHGLSLAVGLDF